MCQLIKPTGLRKALVKVAKGWEIEVVRMSVTGGRRREVSAGRDPE